MRTEPAWKKRATAKTKLSSKVWVVLNSSLVLWLLSAVLLSGLSWLYTRWSTEAESARRARETISHLDQEIVHRMSFGTAVAIQIQSFRQTNGDDEHLKTHLENGRVIMSRIFGIPDSGYTLYPEFKDRTLESLLVELSGLLKGKQRSCLRGAAHDAWEMSLRFQGIDHLDTVADGLQANLGYIARMRWGYFALWGTPGNAPGKYQMNMHCDPPAQIDY